MLNPDMIKPGYYQLDFRGLTLRELIRFSPTPKIFLITLILKLRGRKSEISWFPQFLREATCPLEELDPEAVRILNPLVAALVQQGFRMAVTVTLHPKTVLVDTDVVSGGAYLFKDATVASLLYVRSVHRRDPAISVKKTHIGFVTKKRDADRYWGTSNSVKAFDPPRRFHALGIDSENLEMIFTTHAKRIAGRESELEIIPDAHSACALIDAVSLATAEAQIDRGLYRYAGGILPGFEG